MLESILEKVESQSSHMQYLSDYRTLLERRRELSQPRTSPSTT